jgi:hypothetical protein
MHIIFSTRHMGAPTAATAQAGHRLTVFDPVPAAVASWSKPKVVPAADSAARWRRRKSS